MKRKIILNLAISLDGYIADQNGGFDWIKGDSNKSNDTNKQFSFPEFLKDIDVILMGKKAFDDSYEISKDMFESKKVYVATHKDVVFNENNVKKISGDLVSEIKNIKKEEGKNIWLFGGGQVIDSFIKANIIDEYIIGIVPIILGKGRKLFLDDNPTIELSLTESTIQEGIIINKYKKKN